MTQPHVTNGGAGTPQSQSHGETISAVSASSAPWLAAGVSRATYYRHRQNNKSDNSRPNGNGNIEPELKLNPEIPPEEKPAAGEYQEKIIPEADAATERLRQQLKALEQSQELSRRHEAQVNQANQQLNQVFSFWKASGLSPDQEQALRANPALMMQLSGFAATEAGKLHPVNSPEYVEAGKKLFFQHLDHLIGQARQHVATQQPAPESAMPVPMPPTPPGLLDPIPARQQPSGRSALVSAPVSREMPGYRQNDNGKVTLSLAEQEAAKIAGVDLATYAREKRRYQILKAQGQVE
jgi:hypothetical protein